MAIPFFSVFTQEEDVTWHEEKGQTYTQVVPKPTKSKVPIIGGIIDFFKRLFKPNQQRHHQKSSLLSQGTDVPQIAHPMLKKTNQCFNHVYSFYLDEQKRIWYALRDNPNKVPNWKPLYFDGLPNDADCQMDIKADGQNLMVRVTKDGKSTVHYKKVLKEKRVKIGKNKFQYRVTGIIERLKSVKDWFSLPIIKLLKPKQLGEKLQLDANAKWAMAHCGGYKHHHRGKNDKQFKIWGVTTVYEVIDGKIILHDPFVSEDSKIVIDLPNTNYSNLEVLEVDASGSTLLIYGMETKIDQHGVSVKEPVLYTKLLDYDVLGTNPLQLKSFDPSKGVRTIPPEGWIKHVLPKARLTRCFNVIQTGIDYDTGELRIEGEQDGENGFYYKKINDRFWNFYALNQPILDQDFITSAPELSEASCDITGYDFSHTSEQAIEINGTKFNRMVCENYQPNAAQIDVTLYDEQNRPINLMLVRKKNMSKAFLGLESESWHLVLKNSALNYKHIFKGRVSMPVQMGTIEGESSALVIQSKSKKANFQVNVPMINYHGIAHHQKQSSKKPLFSGKSLRDMFASKRQEQAESLDENVKHEQSAKSKRKFTLK